MKIILTCEHAGNQVPQKYSDLFKDDQQILETHRGFDPGAFDLFQHLSELSDFKYFHLTSRLLVELNRSIGHPMLFSEFSKNLSSEEKRSILNEFYYPFRNSVEKTISNTIKKGEKLLHLSIHSFTPVLDGEIRNADVGLLFDPGRESEKEFCKILKRRLLAVSPNLRVRFNYPYLGKADGFTTYLRKKFPVNYAGIEIEINQNCLNNLLMSKKIKDSVHTALKTSIEVLKDQ